MTDRLRHLCQSLEVCAKSKKEKAYVESLRTSCVSLEAHEYDTTVLTNRTNTHTKEELEMYLKDCIGYFEVLNLLMSQAGTKGGTKVDELAYRTQHSPRISPTFWLSQLRRERFYSLSKLWKAVIVGYGLAITELQRAHRLFSLDKKPEELAEEILHVGHTNWSPWEFPETLLLEAESGIMVREVQEIIAQQMRNPPGARNAVCQLNMGEGKSSTIVPIVAAVLADGQT